METIVHVSVVEFESFDSSDSVIKNNWFQKPSYPIEISKGLFKPSVLGNSLFYPVDHKNSLYDLCLNTAKKCLLKGQELYEVPLSKTAVVIGTAAGNHQEIEEDAYQTKEIFPYDISENIADFLGITGSCCSVSNACSSSGYAIDVALEFLNDVDVDQVLVGGVEGQSLVTQACFQRMMALDPERCKPFQKERKGTILGSGVSFVLLRKENISNAKRPSLGVLKGIAVNCDAYHVTAPDPVGLSIESNMKKSISKSKLSINDIQCVFPHATGTNLNDKVELEVLFRVFGETAEKKCTMALKEFIGHTAGASSLFALVYAIDILNKNYVPQQDFDSVDSESPFVPNKQLNNNLEINNILISSYAFGGSNISFIVGKPTKSSTGNSCDLG